MRIIAGSHRGRRLKAPAGRATRPTSDRAREALFSILAQGRPPLVGCRFLDLFAGTGAVGLEALSRGAGHLLLVETAADALEAMRSNLDQLGLAERAQILPRDATRLGPAPAPFDLIFADPPYRQNLAGPALAALLRGRWLAPGGRLVLQLAPGEPLPAPLAEPGPLVLEDERRYGAVRFLFLRAAAAPHVSEPPPAVLESPAPGSDGR